MRSSYAGVVSQDVPADVMSTSKVSDGRPSASPDAEGPESDVDGSVEQRRGLHRLPAQQSTSADHTRTAVAAQAAGMFLAGNRVESADAVMVDAEGPVESRVVAVPSEELTEVESVGGAEEARFEVC